MKNLAQEGTKKTKSDCERAKASPNRHVAADVRRRSLPSQGASWESNQFAVASRLRLVTSAATGRRTPILAIMAVLGVLANPCVTC
jgi:hypothetical protein